MSILRKAIVALFILLTAVNLQAKDISQAELQVFMKSEKKPLLLDVRTEDEYMNGYIQGAINIPHTELEQRLAELSDEKSRQIILYCRSGRRAGVAKKLLEEKGFTQLDHLTGDYIAWSAEGLPLVKQANIKR